MWCCTRSRRPTEPRTSAKATQMTSTDDAQEAATAPAAAQEGEKEEPHFDWKTRSLVVRLVNGKVTMTSDRRRGARPTSTSAVEAIVERPDDSDPSMTGWARTRLTPPRFGSNRTTLLLDTNELSDSASGASTPMCTFPAFPSEELELDDAEGRWGKEVAKASLKGLEEIWSSLESCKGVVKPPAKATLRDRAKALSFQALRQAILARKRSEPAGQSNHDLGPSSEVTWGQTVTIQRVRGGRYQVSLTAEATAQHGAPICTVQGALATLFEAELNLERLTPSLQE